ncbi:MAG: protein kinase [Nannocystaceae bacterium]|nr:protein kinase [Nannocystaceae bacterium]
MEPTSRLTRPDVSDGGDELEADAGAPAPSHIGRFAVRRKLGEGGMGVVFAAYDAELDRDVAIKLLRSSAADAAPARARLLREARAMAKLSHPNVITIYDVGTFDDRIFIAMELVHGVNLRRWLKHRPRTWRGVLERFCDAGQGLAAAHAAGIIHRDFKPDNVLVGDDGRVRVLDFGLARRVDVDRELTPEATPPGAAGRSALVSPAEGAAADVVERLTVTGAVMGTPAYMAPEQWRGLAIDHRTDQFAFCVALWEGLFGQRPFGGTGAAAIATRVMGGELRRPPEDRPVPTWLLRVLRRGLSVDPDARFPSMGELLDVLTRLRRERGELELVRPVEPVGPLFARRYELRGDAGGERAVIARDRLTRRTVAIHRLPPELPDDETLRERLRRLVALQHPGLAAVLEQGREHGEPYLALEHFDGAVDWLEWGRDQPQPMQLALVAQLLRALDSLHGHALVHGQLSRESVMVVDGQLKIVDTTPCLGHGAPSEAATPYVAPELLLGEARDPRADLYSVGVLAHELLLGRRPTLAASPSEVVDASISGPRLDLAALEAELAEIVAKLLSPEPDARPASAAAALRALATSTRAAIARETVETRESALRTARFAGREHERTALVHALRRSLDGAGELWLVAGESGVGKSRLLDELRAEAVARGAMVVRGQCRAEGGRPYEVWRECFRALALCASDDLGAAVFAPLVPDIDALRGRATKVAPELDAQSTQQRLLRATVHALRSLSSPLLLLLDDLQWSGSEGIDLLERLSGQLAGLPVLVVGSYRVDEAPQLPTALPAAKCLTLAPLSRAAIAELAQAMTGASAAEPLAALLDRESEGNPLLLVEVMRYLAEEVGELQAVGRAALPPSVDAGGVRRVMRRRIERIEPWARPWLERAAVAGRELDLELLARLDEPESLARFVEHAAACAVLERSDERWRFRHDKLREYVLGELGPERRRTLHLQIGRAIVEAGEAQAQAHALAHHFHEAGELREEAEHCAVAGAQALDNGGYRDAVRLLSRAVELREHARPEPLARMQQHRMLGEAHYVLGDLSRAVEQLASALREGGRPLPGGRAGWLWLLLRLVTLQLVLLVVGSRVVARRERRRAELHEAAHAAGRLANLSTYSGDMPRILACSLLAANLSERAGKPVPYALAVMGYSASYLGLARLAERYFGRASAAARAQDDPTALVEATQMECASLLGVGAFERCKSLLDDGYAAAERADYQLGLALSEGFAGQCEFHLGNFESMLAHYCRAQELLTVSTPEHEHSLLCGQALALCMLGRFDEAELLLADGAARVGAQYLLGEAFVQATRCYAWAWGGDRGRARDGALATNRYVAEHAIAIPPPCGHVLAGPAEALLAALRVDPDPKLVEAARAHARTMATWARKHPVGEAPALLFAAQLDLVLGERERASDGLEQALVAAKRLALRFVQAQAEFELGRLRGAGTEPGRGHLERALDLALRCGAAHHARAARRALDAVHVDAGGPDRVTRAPGG